MTEDAAAEERPEISPRDLDPFSYFPGVTSKIRGLGGSEERPELAYGFHTDYVRCAPGYCSMRVKFDGLTSKHGLIHLRVHMLSTRPGAQARVVTAERIYLADLAGQQGEAIVRFESLPGMTYAMFGQVLDATDAAASGLTVTLDRPGGPEAAEAPDAEPTRFGQGATRGTGLLVSPDDPILSDPVSQVMNPAQLREPAFARWQGYLAEPDRASAWEQAFILQALDRYEMLDRGADGIGHADLGSAVPAILVRRQCVMTLVAELEDAPTELASRQALLGRIRTVAPDEIQALAASLQILLPDEAAAITMSFDFAWSLGVLHKLPGFPAAMRFMEDSMTSLRPGGVGVHVMRVALDMPTPEPGFLTRVQIERIALNLISQGHGVAQLRFQLGEKPRGKRDPSLVTPFGLVVRKG